MVENCTNSIKTSLVKENPNRYSKCTQSNAFKICVSLWEAVTVLAVVYIQGIE